MENLIVNISVTTILGIIAYFLKRTMNTVDKHETGLQKNAIDIKGITMNVEKNEKNVETLDKEVELIKENYTPKAFHTKDFDECKNDIKQMKEDYITKEDFYRELHKVDRDLCKLDKKIDYITDILIQEVRGKVVG